MPGWALYASARISPVPPVRARYAVPLRDLNRGGVLRPVVAGAARQVAPTEDPVWHGNPR